MPCSDTDSGQLQYEYGELRKKLDHLTRLLCEACKILEIDDSTVSVDLSNWYHQHKIDDKKRLEAEARSKTFIAKRKQAVLDRLTAEERYILGFKP